MGILNVTPDSFSDGGEHCGLEAAVAHGERMLAEGAALIDVGGESTRPGAAPVPVEEELRRVVPVVRRLCALGAVVSVDTSAPEVMRAAADAGAAVLNDVRAFTRPGAQEIAAESGLGLCVMHSRGTPATMDGCARYRDVVEEVRDSLAARASELEALGIPREAICLDPGIGFAKTAGQSWQLLAGLGRLRSLGYPVLVGVSRKRCVGEATGVADARRRDLGSVVAAALAAERGADIVRVHAVRETVEGLSVLNRFVSVEERR